MTINVIAPIWEKDPSGKPWILKRCALELKKYIPEIQFNARKADINYFLNYYLYNGNKQGINIGNYTHLEEKGETRMKFLNTIAYMDYFTVTCNKTSEILLSKGVEKKRIYKISYGVDDCFRKKLVFGVVGRTYSSGRKGEFLVKKMVEKELDIRAWGFGWPCKIASNRFEDLKEFYRAIDYLVVTSLNEGGPLPVIEALASGTPVIAPDVGWCWEFPVIRYQKGDWSSLEGILDRLQVENYTWEAFALDHKKMFEEICISEVATE